MVRDRDTVCIAPEVAKNVLRSSEWPFAVDNPFRTVCLPNQVSEHLRSPERRQVAVKAQLAGLKSLLQGLGELATEHFLQGIDRQQEFGV
jgi:hypothetical protein